MKKIILIFDECTSGFRENIGGIHKKYKVNPDMMLLGKAMGNGYPITAILGKKKIMQYSKKTFISSTFWTERLGYTAALSTINFIEKKKIFKKINENGRYIKKRWSEISDKHGLEIKISGLDVIPSFNFNNKFNKETITLFTQEMLKNNILAFKYNIFIFLHIKKHIDHYLSILDKVFFKISKLKNKSELKKEPYR